MGSCVSYGVVGAGAPQRDDGSTGVSRLAEFSAQLAKAVTVAEVAHAVSSMFAHDQQVADASILVPGVEPGCLQHLTTDDRDRRTIARSADMQVDEGSPPCDTFRNHQNWFVSSRAELIDRWPDIEQAVTDAGIGAIATICLDVAGQVLGVLEVSWTGEHEFTAPEREFLVTTAGLLGLVLSRLQYIETQHAQTLRDHARFQLVSALSSATSVAQVAHSIVEHGPAALDADHCWVRLLDIRTPSMLTLASSDGAPRAVIDDLMDCDPAMPMHRAVQLGRPVLLETLDHPDEDVPRLGVGDLRSAAALPLMASGELLGVIGVGYSATQNFDADRSAKFETLVDVSIAAVARVRLVERDRRISHELQQAMLGDIDEIDGLDVDATYRAADDILEAGGDFYDAIALPDGRVGLVVGDIVGHSLAGTAAMGQLRNAVRGAAMCLDDPAELISLADHLARTIRGADMATLAYVIVDRANECISYSTAGHLPPLLVHGDGTTTWLDDASSTPLGLVITQPRSATVPIRHDDTIILYTDGIVERRGETLDDGMRRLQDNAVRHRDHPSHLLASILVALAFDGHSQTDDIALLIARPAPPSDPPAP